MKIMKEVELTLKEEMAIMQYLGWREPKIGCRKLAKEIGVSIQGACNVARRYQETHKQ